jgi:aspartate racemase
MRIIGLIGGMSWESSLEYYRLINEDAKQRLGGFHSAKTLMYSVDFDEVERMQSSGAWDDATELMIDAAQRLERGGADCIVICTNTMHLMAEEVATAVPLPLLHIADTTADAICAQGIQRIALLGTRFTMTQPFYRERLESHGLQVMIPEEAERETIHRIIYDELVKGVITDESRAAYMEIIERMAKAGAEAVILGCTEIGLLIKPLDVSIPSFDTTALHAKAAVDFALA